MSADRFQPFPGLRSFEEHEDHLFFGRERDLDELLRRLRTRRFLAVLGTSGSGKSSLVKCGLVPSLYKGFMSRAGSSWRIALMRPGDDPIGGLAAACDAPGVLAPEAPEDEELAGLRRSFLDSTLRRGDLGLVQAVREARLPPADRLLVVVDQFEELFRFQRSRAGGDVHDDAVAFVQLLLAASSHEEAAIYVVLTMRSDFLGQCIGIPRLAEAVNRGQYLVPLMDRGQRRAAITGPVAVGGGAISARLVLRLLNDVGDDPDQLPILQHALMRSWNFWERDHEPGEPLDLRHYEAVGSLREALDRHAEEAFAELGTERLRQVAERLFKSLTERDPASRNGVRRPTRVEEICALAGADAGEVAQVVEVFRRPGRSFLMPPAGVGLAPGTVVDVSHESLMRVWKRLIGWVDEETEAASFYLRLTKAARRHQEGTAALWREPELGLGLAWQERHRPTAVWAERYAPGFDRSLAFLDASRRSREAEIAREERERRAKLRAARVLAAVLGTSAVLTLAFGVWAWQLRRAAVEQREVARQERRTAEAERDRSESLRREAEKQRAEALRQREEALRQRGRAESESRAADEARRVAERERRSAEDQKGIAEGKEREARRQKQRAESAQEAAESQRRRAEEERDRAEQAERKALGLRRVAEAEALAVRSKSLAQGADRELAALLALQAYRLHGAAGHDDEDPAIYDALVAALSRMGVEGSGVLTAHRGAVRALAMAPDGRTLASGGDDGDVRLLDLGNPGSEPVVVARGGEGIRALAFASAGRRLAVGGRGGRLELWDLGPALSSPNAPTVLPVGDATVASLAFGPGADVLAAGLADGRVRLWDAAAAPAEAAELDGGGDVRSLDFRPDGAALAAATGRGILVWALDRPADEPAAVSADPGYRSVAFGRAGRRLAAGTEGGVVRLWDLERPGSDPLELVGHTARVADLEFHPRRDLLASASFDGTLRLWDLRQPDALPVVLAGHDLWVWAVAFSADGERLVSASSDRTVRSWTTKSSLLAAEICRTVGRDLTAREWAEYLPGETERSPTCRGRPDDVRGGGMP